MRYSKSAYSVTTGIICLAILLLASHEVHTQSASQSTNPLSLPFSARQLFGDREQLDQDLWGPEVLAQRYERNEAIDRNVDLWRWIWGNGYPFEEKFVRERVSYAHDRAYRPEGFARQALSSMHSPGLWTAQSEIECPTLVVHGESDPCFSIEHGRAIQSRINGAELWNDARMGHIMHREQWDELATRIHRLVTGTSRL